MPRPKSLNPAYCLHKPSGRAFVKLDGHRVYLGRHGTQESRDRYTTAIAEWIARGRTPAPAATPAADLAADIRLTVEELIAAFWRHAKVYYRNPDGSPAGELENFRCALRPLRRMYANLAAADFGPLKLKALREEMIRPAVATDGPRAGWSRPYVNKQVGRIKTVFAWAVEHEMIPAAVDHALRTVKSLKRGKSEARETEKVTSVADHVIEMTIARMTPTVAAMVRIQVLTGARPGEICSMRTGDIDVSGSVWVYRPPEHKTAYRGFTREIRIGPAAQKILGPLLRRDLQAFIFSPATSDAERRAERTEARETPPSQGNAVGTNRARAPKRSPGKRYTVASYRRAIARACERAFAMPADLREPRTPKLLERMKAAGQMTAEAIAARRASRKAWRRSHEWAPNRLRHTAGTKLRRDFGIDAASVILGHQSPSITLVYAEADQQKATDIMAKVG